MSQHGHAEREDSGHVPEQTAHIRLVGAPHLFVLDTEAIWSERDADADQTARRIARKLGLLVQRVGQDTSARVIVRGAAAAQRAVLADAIPAEQLALDDGAGPARLDELLRDHGEPPSACLAVLAVPGARVPPDCLVFYSGPGEPPANTQATRLRGSAATDAVLALFGTALAQERAGLAFRATSQRQDIPAASPFDAGILRGIVRSEARSSMPTPTTHTPLPDEIALRALAANAYARLRHNLLPNGVVVGSPARGQHPGEPNYWFFWQRDAAAAMGWLIEWHQQGYPGLETGDLAEPIGRYLDFLARIQREGHLGTSRYTVAGEPILGYGNPQLDGPALAVLTLTRLADPTRAFAQIQRYLEFLLTPEGQGPTVDAWEFVAGQTFNTQILHLRALWAGADLAAALGRSEDAERYAAAAQRIGSALARFVDEQRGRLVAYRATGDLWFEAISGLDMTVIAAFLANWRQGPRGSARTGRTRTQPGSDLTSLAHPAVLATMTALEDAFESLYQVNRDWRAGGNSGWGLGRFPEDANDGLGSTGGNPWPLTTLWGAQFYYRLAQELASTHTIVGTDVVLDDPRQVAFFSRVAGEDVATLGRPVHAAIWRARLLPALVARGDGYLGFVLAHLPPDGGVTEQIDRDAGTPRGAPDLSWALAELIGTIAVRRQARALEP